LDGEEINIINHWPSRSVERKIRFEKRRGIKQKNNRLFAADKSNAKVTMGDLNDGPYNKV
jgi:hypothetical protein